MRKFYSRILLSIVLLTVSFFGQAQVNLYTFSQSAGTYTPITGGTTIKYGDPVTNSSVSFATLDDDVYRNRPIGFTLKYNGTDYTQFGFNSNGWLLLGNSSTFTSSASPISTTTASIVNLISAAGFDIGGVTKLPGSTTSGSNTITLSSGSTDRINIGDSITGTGISSPGAVVTAKTATTVTIDKNSTSTSSSQTWYVRNGEIRYETIGTAPNRILVLQFKNFSRWATTYPQDEMNFQIRLHETSNVIQVVYGTWSTVYTGTGGALQVGLKGASNSDYNNRTTTTDWAASTAGTSNSSSMRFNDVVFPSSGLTYTWTPFVIPPIDLELVSIGGLPTGPCPVNNVPITATIKNTGSNTIDFSTDNASVTVNITGAAAQSLVGTITSGTLAPGATMVVALSPNADFSNGGNYNLDGTVAIAGDGLASNNTATASISLVQQVSLPISVDFTGFTGTNLNTVFPLWKESTGATTPSGTTSAWTSQTNLGHTGNVTAKVNLFSNTKNEWIVGPRFTASASTALKFDVAVTNFGSTTAADVMGSDDRVSVMISTDCGLTWTEVKSFTVADNLTPALLNQTVALSAYAGQNIMVAFKASEGSVNDLEDYDFHLDNIMIAGECSGTPTGGTANTTSGTVCFGSSNTLTVSGASPFAFGTEYQWQSAPISSSSWSDIAGATSDTYVYEVISSLQYRLKITCANSSLFDFSSPVSVTVTNVPTYATLPYTQGFENWINGCSTSDRPDVHWANIPPTGNNSWRRNDQGVSTASWSSNNGAYSPVSTEGATSARFHSYNSPNGTTGILDLFVNFSSPDAKLLKFDYINTSGNDSLVVLLSSDGGMTFTRLDSFKTRANWSAEEIMITSTSATTVLRFKAYSDFGTTDIGIDNLGILISCAGTPTAGSISVSSGTASICNGSSTTLQITGQSQATGITYQWQSSTDNSTFANITGANSETYVASPTADTYYRAIVACSNSSQSDTTSSFAVTVINPQVTSTTPASRCGIGQVTLSATGSAGTDLTWYANATGGSPIGTGTTFTTPELTSTTTYYVAASIISGSETAGKPAPTSTLNTSGDNWGLVFDVVNSPIVIQSVDVFSVGAGGTITVNLTDNTGAVLATAGPFTYGAGSTASPVAFSLPVNFSVPVGTGFRIIAADITGGNLIRESSGNTYPYTSPSGNVVVTSGYISGTSSSYYWFYNWQVTAGCVSARVPVAATVTTPPAITVSPANATICSGDSQIINVSSTNSNYTYTWMPGNLTGASQTVSPTDTTTYVVTATDNSGGANDGCVNRDSLVVNVNPVPSIPVLTASSDTVCIGQTINLTAASISNAVSTIYSENFNGTAVTVTVVDGNPPTASGTEFTVQTSPYIYSGTTFASPDNTKFIMANSDVGGSGSTTNTSIVTPTINTSGYNTLNLSFNHHYQYWNTGDTTLVQVSTDGGTTWTTVKQYTSNQGTVSAFVQDVINLDSYAGNSALMVRFRYRATWGYRWAIDDITLSGFAFPTYSWVANPDATSGLPATAGTPSASNNAIDVTPTAPGTYTYTVTSTNVLGCTSTETISVLINAITAIISEPTAQTVCAGDNVTFSVTSDGSNLTYQWRKGGADITGATSASYTITGAAASDAGSYDVIVMGGCGNDTSAVATLTVNPTTVISVDPATQTVCAGSNVTFTTTATGSGALTYQWRKGGTNITGATAASYTITGATTSDAGSYDVIVMGGCGNDTSAVATLTVNPSTIITTDPTTQAVCAGGNVTFTTTATGSGTLTYQWRKGGTNITGATSASYTITGVAAGDAGSYDVIVMGGCGNDTSAVATLTINPTTVISVDPSTQTVCAGSNVTFTTTATGSGTLTYQWRKGGTNITGATSASYTITGVAAGDAGSYDVIVMGGCGNDTSAVATLSVTAAGTWTGTTSTDWNDASNWCGGLPTSTSDVTIPSGVTNMPVINTGTGTVRNITIASGATLTVGTGGTLELYGDYTNNGTMTATNGTVSFRGAANQNVQSLSAANVIMNGAGGITLTGNMNVGTALTLTNGNITLGSNNLTMTAGATGSTASHIITNGTGAVTINNITTTSVTFPIAPNATSYNPVMVANGSGRNFTARVATGVTPTILNPARAINRTWNVTANTTSATAASITFGYADTDANASVVTTANMEVGVHNGSGWLITTHGGGVAPTGTAALRLVTTETTLTGPFVVANVSFITAVTNVDADVTSVQLMPNVVNDKTILRVIAKRSMKIGWTITDGKGRQVMMFDRSVLQGQNDMQLNLSQLASGTYYMTGRTEKGETMIIRFVRL